MPITSGPTPATAETAVRAAGAARRARPRRGGDDAQRAPSFCPLALPATDGGGLVEPLPDRATASPATRGSPGPRVLAAIDDDLGRPAVGGDGHRHDLVGGPPRLLRRHGTLVRAHRQLVLLLAADAVLLAQVLRGLQHPAGDRVELAARGLAGPVEPVEQADGAGADALAPQRVVLDLAHRLGAAATTTRAAPVATCLAAYRTACRPEPHRRSICSPGTPTPRPASRAAIRPMAAFSPLACSSRASRRRCRPRRGRCAAPAR